MHNECDLQSIKICIFWYLHSVTYELVAKLVRTAIEVRMNVLSKRTV